MSTENLNIVDKIDDAFKTATATTGETKPLTWANPEEYTKATGRRFRMTNEEITKFGKDEAGRQKAFEERQQTGTLV